jgi:hypothetical protein
MKCDRGGADGLGSESGFAALRRDRLLLIFGAVCAVAGAVAIASFGASGRFWQCFEITRWIWAIGTAPALLVLLLFWGGRGHRWARAGAVGICVALFLALLVPANFIGYLGEKWTLPRYINMANAIAGQLEMYRERHGSYPSKLAELEKSGFRVNVPRIASEHFYTSSKDSYDLFMCYKNLMLSYYSPTRRWIVRTVPGGEAKLDK